jgi:hypothetical protein
MEVNGNIKMALRDTGSENWSWMELIQDYVQFWYLQCLIFAVYYERVFG